jgi:hypothetical protein
VYLHSMRIHIWDRWRTYIWYVYVVYVLTWSIGVYVVYVLTWSICGGYRN